MGLTIEVDNAEDLCDLMCNNMIPQKDIRSRPMSKEEEALNYLRNNIEIFGGKFAEYMAIAIQSLEKEIEIIDKYGEVNASAYIQGLHDGANGEKVLVCNKVIKRLGEKWRHPSLTHSPCCRDTINECIDIVNNIKEETK